MINLPLEEHARQDLRAELLDEYLLRAYRRARTHMVSVSCSGGTHLKCRNSGVSCLCLCHDRKRPFWREPHGADG